MNKIILYNEEVEILPFPKNLKWNFSTRFIYNEEESQWSLCDGYNEKYLKQLKGFVNENYNLN